MSIAPSITSRYARAKSGLELRRRDPITYFRFGVERQRDALALLSGDDPIDELHLRSCNKGLKTTLLATYGLSCMQKREELDGVRLPRWRGRIEAVQLVLDYKQQLLSVQPAYERMLGEWPHHWGPRQGEAYTSLRVMPKGGNPDSETGWSVMHFLSQKNMTSGTGVRGDLILFDEPPVISILRELRKAAHAGRPSVTIIGETPTIRRQWAPIREDYGDCPRRTLQRVDQERAECRWSLDEVADWVLSPAEKAKLLRKYLGPGMDVKNPRDPLALARIHGDYCNTEGSCPFHLPTLELMLAECRPPLETVNYRINQTEGEGDGKRASRTVPVEIWKHPEPGKTYIVTIDPSSGVDDSQHDPYDLEVTEVGTGDLCAQSGGYLSGYLVGGLAAGLAVRYNRAGVDPEVNDRWGVNVVEGVHAARYGHFLRERRELSPGKFSEEIGFHNTQKSRPVIIGAIQQWIDSWQAGVRYAACPSRKVIETLMDCILDADGKVVGAPGVHDECLIVRGQALRRAVRRRGMEIPDVGAPELSHDQKLIRRITGRSDEREAPVMTPGFAQRPRV